MTEWRSIPQWPDYEASACGRIRTLKRDGRELKASPNHKGYPQVNLSDRATGRRKTMRVHRLVAAAFVPNPEGLPEVNHIDGDRTNARADNLEWVTPSGNRRHGYERGTVRPPHTPGERHGQSKLTWETVGEARARWAAGETLRSIALRLGVHNTTIYEAVRGDAWKVPTQAGDG